MPKFHLLAGHFLTLKDAIEALPPNVVMHHAFWRMSKQFPDGIFYVNLWPFARTILVVTTPTGATQAQELQLPLPPDIVKPMEVITGGPSLLTMPVGPEWKRWRKAFSPGFSEGYMIGLAPAIAQEVAVFRKLLLEKCTSSESDVFQLEEMTLKLTFDVIASVTL
jgi:sterigmatocystin biosynthesis cytochrome P450 monooxygenase